MTGPPVLSPAGSDVTATAGLQARRFALQKHVADLRAQGASNFAIRDQLLNAENVPEDEVNAVLGRESAPMSLGQATHAAALTLGEGATLGGAAELSALARAGASYLPGSSLGEPTVQDRLAGRTGPVPFGQRLQRAYGQEQGLLARAHEMAPGLSNATELSAAFASPLATALVGPYKAAIEAGGFRGALGAMGAGANVGGVAGLLGTEGSLADRIRGGANTAVGGAGLAAIPQLFGGATRLAARQLGLRSERGTEEDALRAIRNTLEANQEIPSVMGAGGFPVPQPRPGMLSRISTAIRGKPDPFAQEATRQAGLPQFGKPLVQADIMPGMQGLLGQAVQASPQAEQWVRQALTPRLASARQRTAENLLGALGIQQEVSPFAAARGLFKAASDEADRLYPQLYANKTPIENPELETLLLSPEAQSAFHEARANALKASRYVPGSKIGAQGRTSSLRETLYGQQEQVPSGMRGLPPYTRTSPLYAAAQDDGSVVLVRPPTIEDIDRIKQGFDDELTRRYQTAAGRPVTSNQPSALSNVSDAVLKEMRDKIVTLTEDNGGPTGQAYKAVRGQIEGVQRLRRAVLLGKAAMRASTPESLTDAIENGLGKTTSPDEQYAFRVGAYNVLKPKIMRGLEASDPARLLRDEGTLAALRAIAPNPADIDQLEQALGQEATMNQTSRLPEQVGQKAQAGILDVTPERLPAHGAAAIAAGRPALGVQRLGAAAQISGKVRTAQRTGLKVAELLSQPELSTIAKGAQGMLGRRLRQQRLMNAITAVLGIDNEEPNQP